MKHYAVSKTNKYGRWCFVPNRYPADGGGYWIGVRDGDPIPDRARFDLSGDARDFAKRAGGRVVAIDP